MTCIAQTHSVDLRSAWLAAFAALGAALAASVRIVLAARRQRHERMRLAELGPGLLKDLGLTRADVETEYSRPFSPYR